MKTLKVWGKWKKQYIEFVVAKVKKYTTGP